MVFNSGDRITVVLGDEFDNALRIRLLNALYQLGATPSGSTSKFVAGSQDVEEFNVWLEGSLLHIEAETYVGLSVTGPSNIVKSVQQLIAH